MSASIRFSHTIVHSRDKRASARFLSEMLGLPEPAAFGHFAVVVAVVALAHDASLDFLDAGDFDFQPQHYAFLVDEADFDRVKARLDDPDGHLLEVHTRPYGSGGPTA